MFNRYKILAAYLLAIPLALILGILAASPNELTFMLIGMLLFFLALPVFIKWHGTRPSALISCQALQLFG